MIYLDNSATTKPSEAAVRAADDAMMNHFGNPSSLHTVGFEASGVLDAARKNTAAAMGAREDEIFFTSGGTESNNLAIFGAAYARKKRGNRIVSTEIEHSSVLKSLDELENSGFEVVRLRPLSNGIVPIESFEETINEDTVLVSCMLVNNETGALLPVEKIKSIINEKSAPAIFHADAVQAFGKMKVSPAAIGADLMTVSAHKIHGIKGCGALYIRKGVTIRHRTFGGMQENSVRPGTEAVPAIAAFGAACGEIDYRRTAAHMAKMKKAFIEKLSAIDGIVINSPENGADSILNISVLGYRSETLLHALSMRDIFVSSGSACKKGEKSYVLTAQGLPAERIDSALRISFCSDNSVEEAEMFANELCGIMKNTARSRKK